MTATTVSTHAPPRTTHARLGQREIRIVRPSRRDPRLRLSAVILTIQLLGQTVLEFRISIAQIVFTIALAGIIDLAVTLHRDRVLALPASGMLTGSSVALFLRAAGTEHGDWWSLEGIQFFALAAVLALLSKYLIRPGGRHVFNPSNVGLVWCLLVIGPQYVFPQYLWWGPPDVPVLLAWAVILLGGLWVLRSLRMGPMVAAFLITFLPLIAIFAAAGQSFSAIWHHGPVTGTSYWLNICASPELMVFVLFMMSDPQTAPSTRRGRVLYGALTALVAAALIFFQQSEFGIKLAILVGLTVSCALVPLIERATAWAAQHPADAGAARRDLVRTARRAAGALRKPALVAVIIIAVAAPANTAALANDEQILDIERGLMLDNPQQPGDRLRP